ncbi:GH11465 [Drosophila grimshawi]|uniref:GH11465 n=2 Tax=Drosophila grimshawi TaxID=7222 RepID=B4JAP4_DROGR|nr:GH11465 [Drosophila grimshawi]
MAFACLFSIGNSDLGLHRDIRNPDNPEVQEYIHMQQRFQTAQASLPTRPPLASPALVAGVRPYSSTTSQPRPVFAPLPAAAPVPIAPSYVAPYRPSPPAVDVRASDDIARNILTFTHQLANQINENYRKTTIFSPLSIVSALALLLVGAKGRSYSELAAVFGLNDIIQLHEQFGLMVNDVQQPTIKTTSPLRQLDEWHYNIRRSLRNYPKNRNAPHELHVANGLFVQQGYSLNPDYRQAIYEVYNSDVKILDFENNPTLAKNMINAWVSKHTRGKIDNIIADELPHTTRMIMANALYFKAMWEIDFIVGSTRVEDFYPNGEGTQPAIPVEMMVGAGSFPYYEDVQLNCRIIGLPYHGNLTTMYIIQPMRSSVEQLSYLQQSLTADVIEQMIRQMVRRSIIVAFPKLHITESLKLQRLLQRMGLAGIFMGAQSDFALIGNEASKTPAYSAVNSGLSSLENLNAQRRAAMQPNQLPTPPSELMVADILHKVDFVVNEQGTEAAAASAAVLKKSGPDVVFRAETPFIVLVRSDLTKLPLFYGIINEPPAASPSTHRNI